MPAPFDWITWPGYSFNWYYCVGMQYTAYLVGLYWLFFLLAPAFKWLWAFIDDAEWELPKHHKWIEKKVNDFGYECDEAIIFRMFLASIGIILAWLFVLIGLFLWGLLLLLRWMRRTTKIIGKLMKVAHKHPEEIEHEPVKCG